MTGSSERAPRIAVLEANTFHEEVVFALACAASASSPRAQVTVHAPEHWASREFLCDELLPGTRWRPFDVATTEAADADLVVVSTFPSPKGQHAVDELLGRGSHVLGLVHDPAYLARGDGARAALSAWPRLTLAHASPVPAPGVLELPEPLRARVHRLVPVVDYRPLTPPHERAGVSLPGSLELARRDFRTAISRTASTGIPLSILGRTTEGDGPPVPRDLPRDRRELLDLIADLGAGELVRILVDVDCSDFYRTVGGARFVAVLPLADAYHQGKLSGALTAALSCGVPMIVTPEIYRTHVDAVPGAFDGCMLGLDAAAGDDEPGGWRTLACCPEDAYDTLSESALRTRDRFLADNASLLRGLLQPAGRT